MALMFIGHIQLANKSFTSVTHSLPRVCLEAHCCTLVPSSGVRLQVQRKYLHSMYLQNLKYEQGKGNSLDLDLLQHV